mgnify:CR=1 FL=1|jgi:hypothetical protein|tara:strand:- start:1704 stop:2189 length:486 start_codon:yes stop_codon:yes gene_type:complete
MGWLKDVFNPSGAENDRYNDLLNKKRREYPQLVYDFSKWKVVSPTVKLSKCQDLGADVEVLRLLKAGKLDDNALSDGHRVDERGIKVYTKLYNEYNNVYRKRYCDPILNTNIQNQDAIQLKREADQLQDRIEKDTDKQRTIIIAVGGVVLLLGTTLILRKL